MNIKDRVSLYEKLIDINGDEYQLKIFITEMYELMTEVSKSFINDSKKDTIYQELADSIICYEQFCIYALKLYVESIPQHSNIFKDELTFAPVYGDIFISVNETFTKIMKILNDYLRDISIGEYDRVIDFRYINDIELLFTIFFENIKMLLVYVDNFNTGILEICIDYKVSRLNNRVVNKKHL